MCLRERWKPGGRSSGLAAAIQQLISRTRETHPGTQGGMVGAQVVTHGRTLLRRQPSGIRCSKRLKHATMGDSACWCMAASARAPAGSDGCGRRRCAAGAGQPASVPARAHVLTSSPVCLSSCVVGGRIAGRRAHEGRPLGAAGCSSNTVVYIPDPVYACFGISHITYSVTVSAPRVTTVFLVLRMTDRARGERQAAPTRTSHQVNYEAHASSPGELLPAREGRSPPICFLV